MCFAGVCGRCYARAAMNGSGSTACSTRIFCRPIAGGHGTRWRTNRNPIDVSRLPCRTMAAMRRFARRLMLIALRREVRSRRGRHLDLPGTIRRSVESGGTPMRVAWKSRRRIRPRLVLLLDVSRSMSAYSVFFLRLARALTAELSDVHCFVFHTRIVSVSDALADTDPKRAQDRLHVLSAGWAGGTRIGESLEAFNRVHAPRLVHSRTAVIVVSDGYD